MISSGKGLSWTGSVARSSPGSHKITMNNDTLYNKLSITFTEEILNGKNYFLCSGNTNNDKSNEWKIGGLGLFFCELFLSFSDQFI